MFRIFSRAGGNSSLFEPILRAGSATSGGTVARALSGHLATSAKPGIFLILLALVLTGCGGGGGSGAQSASSPAESGFEDAGVSSPSETGGREDAASSGTAASSSAAASAGAAAAPSGAGERADGGSRVALPGFDGEKIVKTAELGVRAEDVRESASRAQEVASRFGGSVTSSRVDGGDGTVSADLVLSVPSGEFEAVLDELRGLGEVTTDNVGGEDVTEEFVDLQSRERNLLAAEGSLLRLYDEAESVDDALSVERELTDLRGQIEVVQGRIQYLEDRTTTSRIALAIQPPEKLAETRPALEPARAVSTAWNASLAFLGTVAGAVLSVVVFGWWLAPALVAAAIFWRRRNRHAGPAAGP